MVLELVRASERSARLSVSIYSRLSTAYLSGSSDFGQSPRLWGLLGNEASPSAPLAFRPR